MWEDFNPNNFEWIDGSDYQQGVVSFLRKDTHTGEMVLVVAHFTPTLLTDYRIGIPVNGFWKEMFNSDAKEYGGSGNGNKGGVYADSVSMHGRPQSVNLTLPPLGILFLKRQSSL